jgi:putative transposase
LSFPPARAIEIINRSQTVGTFKAEPKRWGVERSFAWFERNRRLAKDFEATIESAEAWVMIASVRLLVRRLARACVRPARQYGRAG